MISLEPPAGIAPAGDAWAASGLSRAGLTRFLRRAQAAAGLTGEAEVLLADDRILRRLNRQFRGKNKATDVLSFPAPPEMAAATPGDLAISLETAARQAAEYGHTLRDEVRILLVHGLLHLSGMDHEADEGEMAAHEDALRKVLHLKRGLIARTTAPAAAPRVTGKALATRRVGRKTPGERPGSRVGTKLSRELSKQPSEQGAER